MRLWRRIGSDWTVVDDGSRNGTLVNGERLWDRRRLRNGDTLTVGQTSIVFRSPARPGGYTTRPGQHASIAVNLSQVDRRLLVALCRPLKHAGPDPSCEQHRDCRGTVSERRIRQAEALWSCSSVSGSISYRSPRSELDWPSPLWRVDLSTDASFDKRAVRSLPGLSARNHWQFLRNGVGSAGTSPAHMRASHRD